MRKYILGFSAGSLLVLILSVIATPKQTPINKLDSIRLEMLKSALKNSKEWQVSVDSCATCACSYAYVRHGNNLYVKYNK